jgi:hypothetical protein
MHCSLFECFPRHAENAINCQGQPTSFRKVVTSSLSSASFWTRQNCLLRLNACSQHRFWVVLDTILISCTSARFICPPSFLRHNVQPNCEHEDIYHCRHNGWHSSHWLSRYALSISKTLQLDSFCDRLELGPLALTNLTYTCSLRSLLRSQETNRSRIPKSLKKGVKTAS